VRPEKSGHRLCSDIWPLTKIAQPIPMSAANIASGCETQAWWLAHTFPGAQSVHRSCLTCMGALSCCTAVKDRDRPWTEEIPGRKSHVVARCFALRFVVGWRGPYFKPEVAVGFEYPTQLGSMSLIVGS